VLSRYRFALRPKWILSHLFVIAMVFLMINLGFWQLRRLDQRKAFNEQVRENAHVQPIAAEPGLPEWRRVTLRGTYRQDSDVLVANRTQNSQPGYWVVTPLERDDGTTVVVSRGFVPLSITATGGIEATKPPTGPVEIVGLDQNSRGGGRFATGQDASRRPEITQVDLRALGRQWNLDLAPFWVQMTDQQPANDTTVLTPVPEPELNNGPHLSYAVQWFLFSTIAVVGYPLVLRRNADSREKEKLAAEKRAAGAGPDPDPGAPVGTATTPPNQVGAGDPLG
jgi:cytochrome oxidase assembly protein ShyY1